MLSRVEHEMNMNWARQHPKLFVEAVDKFQETYGGIDWKVSIKLSRKDYVTLIAVANP